LSDSCLIAIVDDDSSLLRALARLFRGRGYEVETYTSARHFLATLDERQPDCLLVDFRMPEMSGVDLLRALRERGARLPAILMTAFVQDNLSRQIAGKNVVAVLYKPLQEEPLFEAIGAATRPAGD